MLGRVVSPHTRRCEKKFLRFFDPLHCLCSNRTCREAGASRTNRRQRGPCQPPDISATPQPSTSDRVAVINFASTAVSRLSACGGPTTTPAIDGAARAASPSGTSPYLFHSNHGNASLRDSGHYAGRSNYGGRVERALTPPRRSFLPPVQPIQPIQPTSSIIQVPGIPVAKLAHDGSRRHVCDVIAVNLYRVLGINTGNDGRGVRLLETGGGDRPM